MIKHFTLLAVFLLVASCAEQTPAELSISGQTMGTTYTVKIVPGDEQSIDLAQLKMRIDEALIEVNHLMSTYDPNSELSRFNVAPANQPFAISSQTELVITEALRLANLSDGMLDVTVGPLVNLWGFGPDKRPETIPTKDELSAIGAYVGIDKFELASGRLTKRHADVYIDLSTIAKGYGVDVVANILEKADIVAYLVEIGGEMKVKGKKSNEKDWIVAIEKPINNERAIQRLISVGDNALATSGDYRNYYESDGIRYSHLIDPTTGYPIAHNLVSVTVVHPSSMTADGLATALNVMGPKKAKALAEKAGLSVLMITKEDTGFVEYRSPEFEKQTIVY